MSSSDFSKPQTTDTYVNVTGEINAIAGDLAKGLDPATTSAANLPTGAVRWNSANGFWEKFTGTTWNALATIYNIVAAQAAKLASAVTLGISGDIAGSASFDGSQNVTITATLPTVNANPGTVGSTSSVPVITTNAKGQVTAVGSAAIPPSIPTTAQVTAALNGAALAGPLTLAADPAAALQPATKQYVDAGVASANSAASTASTSAATALAKVNTPVAPSRNAFLQSYRRSGCGLTTSGQNAGSAAGLAGGQVNDTNLTTTGGTGGNEALRAVIFTAEIAISSFVPSGGYEYLLSRPSTQTNYHFLIGYNCTNWNGSWANRFGVVMINAANNGWIYAIGNAPAVAGQNYTVSVKADGANLSLFVNGVKQATTAYSGSYNVMEGVLMIGITNQFGAGDSYGFEAGIEEARFWSAVLTDAQIAAAWATDYYTANAIPSGLVALWDFSEGAGPFAKAMTAPGTYDPTMAFALESPSWVWRGPASPAIATSDYVVTGTQATFDRVMGTPRLSRYTDERIANCQGIIPNGNCLSDDEWTPPNGNWWSWGLGSAPAFGVNVGNPSGFDFAGGQTATQTASTSFNSPVYNGYGLDISQVGYDEYRRTFNNCNCTVNCFNNCNCNCNCNCCNCCG